MRILIAGHRGQVGTDLCRGARAQGFDVAAMGLPELDIADAASVRAAIRQARPSLVVNAAAYTAVDRAEAEPDLAFAANRDGPAALAAACAEADIALVHISTDYVYDGTKAEAYVETDPIRPLGVYGQSKAAGDRAVCRLERHVIIRPAWVYGVQGTNFVKTMLRLGREKETLRVVDDQVGCPTYAADLAEAILTIIQRFKRGDPMAWGTYHYCGRGAVSWYGFAEAVFELARPLDPALIVKRVEAIPTHEYPLPARRPANSVLDCTRIAKAFGIQTRPWRDRLAHMLSLTLGTGLESRSAEGSRA